jgi:hypothetical protein
MKPAHDLYVDILAMQAQGLKPFQIVKRILAEAPRSAITLTGTLNNSELVFSSGEVIAFDGSDWHYRPADPGASAGKATD